MNTSRQATTGTNRVPVPDYSEPRHFETVKGLDGRTTTIGSAYLIALTAVSFGLKVEFFRSPGKRSKLFAGMPKTLASPVIYRVSSPKRSVHFFGSLSERFYSKSYLIDSKDKSRTKAVLHHAGVATPFGGVVWAGNTAVLNQLAAQRATRVVLKPITGSQAIGVLANIPLDHALAHISINPQKKFMVEQYIAGQEMRVYTLGNEVIAAYARGPSRVVGDGEKTLGELVDDLIAHQASNPVSVMRMHDESSLKSFATRDGRNLSDVPDAGASIPLEAEAAGGTIEVNDCLGDLSSEVIDVALRASKSLGAQFSGLDVMETASGEVFVLELNAKPSIFRASFPNNAAPNLEVPEALLRAHFAELEKAEPRLVSRFDFLSLMDAYQNQPKRGLFDVRDYIEFA